LPEFAVSSLSDFFADTKKIFKYFGRSYINVVFFSNEMSCSCYIYFLTSNYTLHLFLLALFYYFALLDGQL